MALQVHAELVALNFNFVSSSQWEYYKLKAIAFCSTFILVIGNSLELKCRDKYQAYVSEFLDPQVLVALVTFQCLQTSDFSSFFLIQLL